MPSDLALLALLAAALVVIAGIVVVRRRRSRDDDAAPRDRYARPAFDTTMAELRDMREALRPAARTAADRPRVPSRGAGQSSESGRPGRA